jgi:hypothetical protein
MVTDLKLKEHIVSTADAIRADRYADSAAFFVAGSLVRGEGTAYSDLDLVVVYPTLTCAYRESFRVGGYPVEAFVHDPETLEYFFLEADGPSGIPALAQMIVEGIEIPEPSALSQSLKHRAASILASGPPSLDTEGERRLRYAITDALDDLRGAASYESMLGVGSELFQMLANYYFRSQGLWSARGKRIPRALTRTDPALGARYCQAFEALFKTGDSGPVIHLVEDLLAARGGPLFEGYRSDAPEAWRVRPNTN